MEKKIRRKLRLAFLVGCLEPGSDGVGDYTYTLAKHLCQTGHTCLIIALKDTFIVQPSVHPQPLVYHQPSAYKSAHAYPSLSYIRFRNIMEHQPDFEAAVQGFQPDLISLQFVPYAFDTKGLPFFLGPLLKPLAKTYPIHIMMHELWIGFEPSAPFKHKCLGYIQKWCIQSMLTKLKPLCLHTHARFYQKLLAQIHPTVSLLPLFSSLQKNSNDLSPLSLPLHNLSSHDLPSHTFPFHNPQVHSPSHRTLLSQDLPSPSLPHQNVEALLEHKGHPLPLKHTDPLWVFSLFGTLHPEWPPEPLIPMLIELSKKQHTAILILHFGHIGRGEALWQAMVERYQPACIFVKLGPLAPADISTILENTHFAIATSPLHLLEKSSSALTFLEWGCPLIVNRIEKNMKLPSFFEERILKINTNNFTQQLLKAHRHPYQSKLDSTCQKFLADIQALLP